MAVRNNKRIVPLTEAEAAQLARDTEAPLIRIESHLINAPVQHLVMRDQVIPLLTGAAIGGALGVVLGVLFESGIWIPPGFAPVATATRAAAAVGGLLAGLGLGGLIGSAAGLILEWRRAAPAEPPSQAIIVGGVEDYDLRSAR